jgi:hypothetical protein
MREERLVLTNTFKKREKSRVKFETECNAIVDFLKGKLARYIKADIAIKHRKHRQDVSKLYADLHADIVILHQGTKKCFLVQLHNNRRVEVSGYILSHEYTSAVDIFKSRFPEGFFSENLINISVGSIPGQIQRAVKFLDLKELENLKDQKAA